jgi:hypothetical protein
VPSAVRTQVAALLFGGTTAVTQSTRRNVATGKTKPEAEENNSFIVLKVLIFLLTKNCTTKKKNVMILNEMIK